MRKSLCSLVLTGALAVAGSAAFAQSDATPQQSTPTAPSQGPMAGKPNNMSPEEQAAHLAKALKLSADQQNQIKPILADRQKQIEALRHDTSMSQRDKFAKMKSLREDSNSKIEAVLNDTQKQRFEQMLAKQQQRSQQKQQGAAPANSPS